jgi:membrane protein
MATVLFAMIFKLLPDARIAWGDVWFGALATAVLFAIGKSAIGLYLGKAGIGSAYGAAGSFVVMLVWVYYSAQVLLFGAELTQVWANRRGRAAEPAPDAVRSEQKLRRPERPADEQVPAPPAGA